MFETGQSLDQQQELLELETENERLLLNILPRHVVPFFIPSRRHSQVCVCSLFAELLACCGLMMNGQSIETRAHD